ncbi:MAG: transglycosylase domain-containing protein [Gammaproteobacteria bacterium]|nr:transglycosylase domain-containing protein [Gammaproteobacteria bacterium]
MKLIGTLLARLIGAALALGLAAGIGLVLYAMSLLPELPDADTIADIQLKEPLQVYTSDAKLIGEYGNERRTPIDIENVPQALINAILAAEDDGFYEHPGIDIRGIIRAAIANLRSQGTGQGASTITMQVARNYFLTPEKTYRRKLKEVLLAFRLENQLNKDDILALYINKIFLGHRAYGFAAASFVYYGKPLEELNLAQAAMLAGLPKAPSKNNPVSNPHNAKQRRDYVLRRMRTLNYIDQTQFSEASNSPVTASRHIAQLEADAPYIAEMGRSYMLEKYGDTVYESGYNVYLTIDSRDQAAADKALRRGLMDYDQRHGYRGPIRTNQIASSTPVNQLEEILSEVPQSQELQPAIVVEIGKRSFKAYIKGDVVEVDWDGMKWARKYVSSRKIGAEPGRAGDIVNVGDIVYLKPGIETGWKLAQLPAVAGAIVSVEPKTGALRAVAGGFDYYLSKFNRALQAERQPGSNIKPFIYSAALEYGFTPASLVSGAPISVEDVAQGHWRPENYSGKFTALLRCVKH